MERELEVKVLGIDPLEIEEKLLSLGAELLSDENQTNILIVSCDASYKIPDGSYLRIRTTLDNITGIEVHYLTYKQKLENPELRENIEYTTEISSVENTIEILNKLGYKVDNTGYKHRKSYKLSEARIDIDVWDKKTYPNPYLEIEVLNVEALETAIKELDLDRNNISYKSIKELQDELIK